MNIYSKFAPNVFLAKTEKQYEKAEDHRKRAEYWEKMAEKKWIQQKKTLGIKSKYNGYKNFKTDQDCKYYDFYGFCFWKI